MQTCSRFRTRVPSWLFVLAPLVAAGASGSDRNWSGFRGPDVSGVSDAAIFSDKGQIGLKEAWRTKIGSGYAGVVVRDDFVVTAFQSGENDVLAAFDASSGAERWRITLEETYKGHDGSHDGPLMTPTIAGDKVFAVSARGRFVAVGLETGKLAWEADLVEDYQSRKPHYGYCSSPIVQDGVLVVQLGAEDAAVAGFDPDTGKRLWTAGGDFVDYQSPVPYKDETGMHVLAACRENLYAVNPKTGDVVFAYKHEGTGGTGMMSIVPVVTGPHRVFMAHKSDAACSVSLTQGDDGYTVEQDWEERSIRNSYNVPIFHDGHLYAYSSRFLTCVDAATGKAKWRAREPGDGFMSMADGHLVIATKDGGLHIVKATPEQYQHVAGRELFDGLCWNSPAIAGGAIYIRSLDELVRIDVTGTAPAVAQAEAEIGATQVGAQLQQIADADDPQRQADAFVASVKEFPLIEGDSLVHFLYQGPAGDVAVGSELFGARQERAMQQVPGTNLWYLTVPVEADARVNYVLLEDFETKPDPRNERTCRSLLYGDEMEMNFRRPMEMSWFAMPQWQQPDYLTEVPEEKAGKTEKHELESEKLAGKVPVEVYLPPGYPQDGVRYPVAYIHGGRGAKSMGNLPTALDNLCGTRCRPTIAVLIEAESRGRSQAYAEMVATELVPLIDKTYQTEAAPTGRASVGYGFNGLDALHAGLAAPAVFGKIAAQSAFIFSDAQRADFGAVLKAAAGKPIEIYHEWGKYDLRNPHEAWDLAQVNRDLAEELRDAGFSPKGGEVNCGSGWTNWSCRYHAVFGTLFPTSGASSS